MEKREDRRISMTKRMLKDTLTEMLTEKDIYHISIRELCERADVNRTTFYKHYGNQFDLLDDMESDLLHLIEKTIAEDKKRSANTVEQLLTFFEKDIEFVRLLLNSNVDPEFPQKLFSLAIVESSVEDMMANIEKKEYEYIYRFVLCGAYEMVRLWVNKDDRESPEEMAGIIMNRLYINKSVRCAWDRASLPFGSARADARGAPPFPRRW